MTVAPAPYRLRVDALTRVHALSGVGAYRGPVGNEERAGLARAATPSRAIATPAASNVARSGVDRPGPVYQ